MGGYSFLRYCSICCILSILCIISPSWQQESLWRARNLNLPVVNRSSYAVTALGSRLFFAGGIQIPSGEFTDRVDIYDTSTGQVWHPVRNYDLLQTNREFIFFEF